MSNNIKVAIRLRPLIQREKNERLSEQWEVNEDSIFPIDTVTKKKNGDAYVFDHIFDSKCRNAEIYQTVVHPVVDAAINGFNGTIFAYGQTSSGKTHTMMGSVEEPGLISLTVENIFHTIERSTNRKFLLRVSYLEIYNEKIIDLLDIGKNVKIHEDYNGDVVVNVKYIVTETAEKVYKVMKKGDRARTIGETTMNEKSSRSHAIFRIIIESTDMKENTDVVNVAQLNLVDLAGSERPTHTKATGLRFKEGAHINKSLSVLSLVMKQLSESLEFVNFRDSKLTRILQSSLGGNALTAIICAVTPASLEETHSTLAFASRAKTIKNKPQQNEVITDEALLTRYANQIAKLKQELEKANVYNRNLQVDHSEQALANSRLKERIALLEKSVLTSSKASGALSSSSKHRRRTWCATSSISNSSLPVIYEANILETKEPCDIDLDETSQNNKSILDDDQLDIDEFPFDACELDLIENEKCLRTVIKSQSDLSELSDDPETTPPQSPRRTGDIITEGDSVTEEPEEYVRWLVNASQTPESVLRQRATYYEREFATLKELTKKEKELLINEHAAEMETLRLELEQLKHVQEFERTIKETMERDFEQEKQALLDQVSSLSKENVQLTQQVSHTQQKLNDSECLIDLQSSKHKKREEELIAMLEEESSENPSKVDNVPSANDIKVETENFLLSIKSQLTLLRTEIDTNQPIDRILQVLNDIIKNYKGAVDNILSDSEEVQDFSIAIECMLEIFSNALTNDNMLQEMANERVRIMNKLSHLQVAQHSFDLVCREKNKELTTALEQLAECNSKLETYIEISKRQADECNSLKDIVSEKDKEIEDISDQIMNYIDQLADAEKELLRYRSVTTSEQSCQTISRHLSQQVDSSEYVSNTEHNEHTLVIQQKDLFIQELNDKLSKLETELNDFKTDTARLMQIEQNQISTKAEICQLTEEVQFKNQQILNLSVKIKEYETHLAQCEEKLQLYEGVIKAELDIQADQCDKDIEMRDMTEKIREYVQQISAYEKLLKQYEARSRTNAESQTDDTDSELIQVKHIEDEELQQAVCESSSKADMECQTDIYENEDTVRRSKQVTELSANLEQYMLQVALYKEKLSKYEEISLTENHTQTEKYNSHLAIVKVQAESQTDDYQSDQIQYKNHQIKHLYNQLQQSVEQISVNESLFKQQMELSKMEIDEMHRQLQANRQQLDATNEKFLQLESKFKESTALLNSTQNEIEDLNTTLNMKQQQIEELMSKLDIATTLAQSKQTEVDQLNEQLQVLVNTNEKEVEDLNSMLNMKQQQIEELMSKLDIATTLAQSKQTEVDQLNEQLQVLVNTNEKEVEDLNSMLNMKQQQIEELMSKLDIATTLAQSKQTEVDQLNAQLRDSKEKISLVESQLKQASSLVGIKQNDIEVLFGQISEYEARISAAEIQENKLILQNVQVSQNKHSLLIEDKDKEISAFTSQMQNQTEQLIGIGDKMKHYESVFCLLNTAVSTFKAKMSLILTEFTTSCKVKMPNNDLNVDSFITELNSATNIADQKHIETEFQVLTNAVNYLCETLNCQTAKLKNMEISVAEYIRIQERLNNELKDANDNVDRMKFKLNILEKANNTQVTATEKLRDKVNSLQNTIVDLKIENDKLRDENIHVSVKYDVCKQRIEDLSKEVNEKIENMDNLSKELEAAKLATVDTVQVEHLKKQNRLLKETLEKKIEKLSDKVTNYKAAINKLKNENVKLKCDIENKGTNKQEMSTEIARLKAEMEKRATVHDVEKSTLRTNIEALEGQNKRISQVIEYLEQKCNEKDIDNKMLTKNVEGLTQENTSLKENVRKLNDEINQCKTKINASATCLKTLEEERDSCKKTIHTLENTLGDVQYELHELKYKDEVKQKRIKRQSLQDSSRSLSPCDTDDATGSDNACKCKEYALEVNQYKVRTELIESQLTAANQALSQYREPSTYVPSKQRALTLDKQTQTAHVHSDMAATPSTSRSVDEQDTEIKHLRRKNEHLKELCKIRKHKLNLLEQQVEALTARNQNEN